MNTYGNRLLKCTAAFAFAFAVLLLVGCGDKTPPGAVTMFAAQSGDGEITLSWVNPPDKDLAGVRVVRSQSAPPAKPSEGLEIFSDSGTGLVDGNVTNGNPYFYAAWAYDRAGNHSSPVYASATPVSFQAREEILDKLDSMAEQIAAIPTLTEEEKKEMQDILDETEDLFLGGDPCGAAAVMKDEFLEKCQWVRQTRERPEGEKLYAAGRMVRVNIARTMEAKGECDELQRVDLEAEIQVESEDPEGLSGWSVFGEPLLTALELHENTAPESTFTQVFIPGAEAVHGQVGAPDIPVYRQLVAVPMGDDVKVKILQQRPVIAEEIFLNLYPVQPAPMDQGPDLSLFKDPPFTINHSIYESNEPWPPEPVTMRYIGNGRDLEFYLLEMASGQYYPAENRLELFDYTHLDVEFQGGPGHFATSHMISPFESNSRALIESAINKEVIKENIIEGIRQDIIGEELLILTHPNFYDAAIKLRDWKRSKGIWANVYECGTNSDIHWRATGEQIDAFIEERYHTTEIRVSYVLLLGDAEFIPTFYINNIGTDWPYAILGKPGEDLIADFAVGRIPVDTLDQAMTVVDKTINYEKTPIDDKDFYQNAVLASQFQCCREKAPDQGTDSRTFIQCSEFAQQMLSAAGKTVSRIYARTGSQTPNRYYDGTLLPSALRPSAKFPWDGNTNQITEAWNKGAFLIIHRDHGEPHGWETPRFRSSHIDNLENEDRLPVVFSMNCSTGFFDNETAGGAGGTVANDVYFCERALRKPDGGAVGIFGATRISPSWENTALTMGMMDAIWPGRLNFGFSTLSQRRLGDILNHGKRYILSMRGVSVMGEDLFEDSVIEELYLWHCFGDPTLEIWTKNPYSQTNPFSPVFHHQGLAVQDGIDISGGILVEYGVDNAVITVFERGADQEIPLGRGVVQNGIAQITYLQNHVMDHELTIIASFDNAPAKVLQGNSF
ncbi:MAG TPA: C25 family cysteine peptidase [Candidatus Hydrogenedentes bacterium]|nr:C25 family cysteine peptidase [Candidatus Hydrogenedentota bacterium]